MTFLREYGWLVVGAVGAFLVPLGLGAWLDRTLGRVVALPWGSAGIGFLVFFACAGLYFRGQWVRSLGRRRLDLERQGAAGRLIGSASSDGRQRSRK